MCTYLAFGIQNTEQFFRVINQKREGEDRKIECQRQEPVCVREATDTSIQLRLKLKMENGNTSIRGKNPRKKPSLSLWYISKSV